MTAMSLIGILVMMAAVVVGLVVWLILAYRATKRPYYERYYQRYQPTRRPARAGTRSLASLVDRVHVASQHGIDRSGGQLLVHADDGAGGEE